MGKCKLHWCLAKKPHHEFELLRCNGDCLEKVGVPNNSEMVINRTIKPKVGDLVWCNNYMCNINGFIKQVKSIDGDEMIVQTRYKDESRDFEFYVCECFGVVEMVFDAMGDLCYKRVANEMKGGTELYCDDCEFLNMNEAEQNRIKEASGGACRPNHFCKKYNKRVFHFPYREPHIHPCKECEKGGEG